MKFLVKSGIQLMMTLLVSTLVSAETCPAPTRPPEISYLDQPEPETKFVDNDRDVKDLGTDFVVNQFFRTPDTIYNFMKLVYQSLDNVLKDYKAKNKLEDRAMFLLFKGGNVLRMVSNEVFDLLPPEARALLSEEFVQYFKRSDADFSVYIDERKLNGKDYNKVLDEVTNKIFAELGKIREAFKRNPDLYFNFLRYSPKFASQVLSKYFEAVNKLGALNDQNNPNWYKAKILQMQLLGFRASPALTCSYNGQVDTRIESKDGQLVITKLTDKPDWIVNTDNRTLEWSWGSNPDKKVKFSLVRSKAYFDYIYQKDKQTKRKTVGGELIDVSIPHRKDDRLRDFLDNYDKNVSEYTLIKDADEKFTMKAYSLANLAEDLQFILFDSFERPWDGPKYTKRINRIFFLFIAEMLGNYGLGAKEIADYVDNIKQFILPPLDILYPIDNAESTRLATDIKQNSLELAKKWPKNHWSNDFWRAFANFIEDRLLKNPKDGDEQNLKNFLDVVDYNLNIASKLSRMKQMKIDLKKVYQVELENLF